jgi:hypothetical protein
MPLTPEERALLRAEADNLFLSGVDWFDAVSGKL